MTTRPTTADTVREVMRSELVDLRTVLGQHAQGVLQAAQYKGPSPDDIRRLTEQEAAARREEREAAAAERRAERGDWIEAGHQFLKEARAIIEADRRPAPPPAPEYLRELIKLAQDCNVVLVVGDIRIEPR